MKKVITLVIVALFTSAAFAQEPTPASPSTPAAAPAAPAKVQEPKKDSKAPDTQMEIKNDKKMATNTPSKVQHDYYMMKEGKLMHFSGENTQAQKSVVKFNNGTSMTADGTITSKDGKTTKLENGQCVTSAGVVGDCAKMTKESVPADKMAPAQK